MENSMCFTHRLDLLVKLVDTANSRLIDAVNAQCSINGKNTKVIVKPEGICFINTGRENFTLTIAHPLYEEKQIEVDYSKLSENEPTVNAHLILKQSATNFENVLSVKGALPGIESITAVSLQQSDFLFKEYDERRNVLTVFNRNNLFADKIYYALVNTAENSFEQFEVKQQTKFDRLLLEDKLLTRAEVQFPIYPLIFGQVKQNGEYLLRFSNSKSGGSYLVSYELNKSRYFNLIRFDNSLTVSLKHKELIQ